LTLDAYYAAIGSLPLLIPPGERSFPGVGWACPFCRTGPF